MCWRWLRGNWVGGVDSSFLGYGFVGAGRAGLPFGLEGKTLRVSLLPKAGRLDLRLGITAQN